MKVNGRAMTEKEIEQVLADYKQGDIVGRYKLNMGKEHPIFTKADYERDCVYRKENGFHVRPYAEWVWVKINYVGHVPGRAQTSV